MIDVPLVIQTVTGEGYCRRSLMTERALRGRTCSACYEPERDTENRWSKKESRDFDQLLAARRVFHWGFFHWMRDS